MELYEKLHKSNGEGLEHTKNINIGNFHEWTVGDTNVAQDDHPYHVSDHHRRFRSPPLNASDSLNTLLRLLTDRIPLNCL